MIFSILPLLMNQNYDKKLLVRRSTFLLCFLFEQSEWSEDVSSHTTRLVYIIIPVECVAQRREINQFVQSDILHSVFVLAPAVDQPSLYKCNVVKPWKIWSKCVVPCMCKISLVQKHKYKHCFVYIFYPVFPCIPPFPPFHLHIPLFISKSDEVYCFYCFDAMSGNSSRLLLILQAWWINHLPASSCRYALCIGWLWLRRYCICVWVHV